MSDGDNLYLRSSRSFHLKAYATTLMLQGAGYAALACAVILAIALVLLAISNVLPEASKTAADPTPELSMAAPLPAATVA